MALQVDLINNLPLETLVLVTLKGSPDYKFVNVDEGGIVSSYSARLTTGDHQMLVYVSFTLLPPKMKIIILFTFNHFNIVSK